MVELVQLEGQLASVKDADKIELLLKLSKVCHKISFEKSLDYAMQAYEIIDSSDNLIGKARVYIRLISALTNLGRMGEAEKYVNEAEPMLDVLDDANVKSNLINNMGVYHLRLSNNSRALELYSEALKLREQITESDTLCLIYINTANSYQELGLYEKAVGYYFEALDVETSENENRFSGDIHLNLGNVYSVMKEFDDCLKHYYLSMEIAKENDNDGLLAIVYGNIGGYYVHVDNPDEAHKYFNKSLKINERLGAEANLIGLLNNIGRVLCSRSEYDEARDYYQRSLRISSRLGNKFSAAQTTMNIGHLNFLQGMFDEVIPFYDEAFQVAEEINHKHLISELFQYYCDFYSETDDFKTAYKYASKYIKVYVELFDDSQRQAIAGMKVRYETEQKEKEAEILEWKNLELKAEIDERKKIEAELKEAISKIRILSGFIPICAHCKKIRDDKGFWNQLEQYITEHSEAKFSHGMCPECMTLLYPDFAER